MSALLTKIFPVLWKDTWNLTLVFWMSSLSLWLDSTHGNVIQQKLVQCTLTMWWFGCDTLCSDMPMMFVVFSMSSETFKRWLMNKQNCLIPLPNHSFRNQDFLQSCQENLLFAHLAGGSRWMTKNPKIYRWRVWWAKSKERLTAVGV